MPQQAGWVRIVWVVVLTAAFLSVLCLRPATVKLQSFAAEDEY